MSNPELQQPHNFNVRRKRLLQNHDTFIQWLQQVLNIVAVGLVLANLAHWRDGQMGYQYRNMLVFAILLMIITYHLLGVLRRFDSVLGGIQQLARAWGVVIIILAWVAFLTKTSEQYSRQVIVYWALLSFVVQSLIFMITYEVYTLYRRKYRDRIPALIVGTGAVAHHLALSISKNIWLNDEIVGVVQHVEEVSPAWSLDKSPVLGDSQALCAVVEKYAIRRVYVALPFHLTHFVKDVQERLADSNIDIAWAPDIFEFRLLNHSVREVAGLPLINLNETPLMAGGPAFIKNMMDKAIALAVIIIFAPLLLCCALIVKATSSGPVIFKQVRDGWDGKKFHVYKFRSMYVHHPDAVIKQATKGDSRITPIGNFMRKTSIDELPQLFNVLEGNMSLVGPRPHEVSHNKYYSDKVRAYLARQRIKPGMTGLAQINGLRGETHTLELMSKRVELDLEYISNWSPILDVKILFLTPLSLFTKSAF